MIPHGFRPLLAVNSEKVRENPKSLYMSEKIDGVRILFFDGIAYSRSLKPLPNTKLQEFARANKKLLEGCDGELTSGSLYSQDVLQKSVSVAMSFYSDDPFEIHLFDRFIPNTPWLSRYESLQKVEKIEYVNILPHYEVKQDTDLDKFEQSVLALGGEGVMLRDANGLYKFGRSGVCWPELQKVKRFKDIEGVVIDVAPLRHNANEAELDELGYTKRSHNKDGMVELEALGSLKLRLTNGTTCWVGSGFTELQRYNLWATRDKLLGKLVTIKYFKESADGVPLLPVFRSFRA
jgi:DNA ligase-1